MVPNQAPPPTAKITNSLPPLSRTTTLPPYNPRLVGSDRSLLTPEDAIYQGSPPRRHSAAVNKLQKDLRMTNGSNGDIPRLRRGRHKDRIDGLENGRRKGSWKKLLWVKQSYPDNYTDQDTFLGELQRNPRLQPYDFWPLVADSTVIVQHVCSVIIFVVCFRGIYEKNISSVAVVSWCTVFTFVGWLLWDWWVGQDSIPIQLSKLTPPVFNTHEPSVTSASASSSVSNLGNQQNNTNGLTTRHAHSASASSLVSNGNLQYNNTNGLSARHAHSASASSIHSISSNMIPTPHYPPPLTPGSTSSPFSHRNSQRLAIIKSALLIYFTLLGLSPILKSLTHSTSKDSIWAMSFLLFTINIFFFDYGTPALVNSGGVRNKNIPASLSTNAALMASTVLASRLPSTGQVFSLTLFSIEVFGLFPVFRRYAKQRSWRGHVTLTTLLVIGAGGGVGLILGRGGDGEGFWDFPYKSGIMGVVIGVVGTGLAMGGCSWWLISLQKYKNEIHGPWDPARPIIRRYDY